MKTTDNQCFGAAGCNTIVQVQATVDDTVKDELPEDGTWDVTYRITGHLGGPIVGTFTLHGSGEYDVNEEFVATDNPNTPINVEVLSVERKLD